MVESRRLLARTTGDELAARGGWLPAQWILQRLAELSVLESEQLEIRLDEGMLAFTIPTNASQNYDLPPHYGLKGGAARSLLQQALGLSSPPLRDIDVVRIGMGKIPLDDQIAARYCPDDFRFGRGIEVIGSIDRFFETRDLTVNEVLTREGKIYASIQAVLDHIGLLLRPTRYRTGTLHAPRTLHGITFAKMVRFKAQDGAWEIRGLPPGARAEPFAIALHLRRALLGSIDVAVRYLELCEQLLVFVAPPGRDAGGGRIAAAIAAVAPVLEQGIEFFEGCDEKILEEARTLVTEGGDRCGEGDLKD